MGEDEIVREMERMADENGVLVDATRVTRMLRADIDAGGEFINILRHANKKREFLIITSLASHSVVDSMLSPRVQWSVPHSELKSARAVRSAPRGDVWESRGSGLRAGRGNLPLGSTRQAL